MSKNKKPNQKTVKTAKKPPIAVIVAVAAAVLLVVVAVVGYFHWEEYLKKDNIDPPVTNPIVNVDSGESKYELAQYKNTKMPVEFVEILNKAEQDSYKLCEKNGVALKLGERNISIQEFVLYYYDVYYFQTQSAVYSIQQTGANRTGFDLQVMPADQKHPREDYTWEEQFTLDVIDNMALNYMMFDEAVENGVELSDAEISELMQAIEFIEDCAERNKNTPDDELAGTYGEGITAAMYYAREIVVAYATKYDSVKLSEIKESYDDKTVEAEFSKDKNKHKVAKLRVYPIEGEYIAAEAGAIKTEEDLIKYANNNHPRDTYDADFSTDCGYITKTRVADVYGDEVAEWAFAEGRKAGDISVVEGVLFRYVVYVETPSFYTASCDIIFVGTQYEDTMTLEDRAKIYKETEEKYLKWKNEDGTKEGFLEYGLNEGSIGQETIRLGDYHFQLDNWIFDPARKSGDHTVLDTTGGCGAVYYVEKHSDDYDWEETIRGELATAELKDYQVETLKEEYEVTRKTSVLNKAYDVADGCIKKRQEGLKDYQ